MKIGKKLLYSDQSSAMIFLIYFKTNYVQQTFFHSKCYYILEIYKHHNNILGQNWILNKPCHGKVNQLKKNFFPIFPLRGYF